MNKTNKSSFVILRVSIEMKKAIEQKAKKIGISLSTLIREILEENI